MKKIILEISFLVQGFFPVKNYEIHNFKLQTEKLNEELINPIFKENLFHVPFHLIDSSYQVKGEENSVFLILTNKNFIFELEETSNNLTEKQVIGFVQKRLDLVSIKNKLERELKLITNINIVLPMGVVKYHSSDEKIGTIEFGIASKNFSEMKVSNYTDDLKELLSHRLSRGISIESLDELGEKNSRFKRALAFYYDSFAPSDRSIRFTLLFSSLEALFNLTGKKVIENIAVLTSNILFVKEQEETESYKNIKGYYRKRSLYIHGNIPKEITDKDEFDLKEIVRKVILIYWQISLNRNIVKSEKIIQFIRENNENDLEIVLRLFIKYLEDKDYYELTKDMISIIFP